MSEPINFYRTSDLYGQFSNFWPSPIELDDTTWPTTEHYFQAQKFPQDETIMERIRGLRTGMEAAKAGRDRSLPLRSDWQEVKDEIMFKAVKAKFTQHPDLKELLLGTEDSMLVEHTKNDSYWGDGGDGSGRNQLGKTLMKVRDEIRQETNF